MRLVNVDELTPEMELAETIYDGNNIPLLKEKSRNLDKYVKNIKNLGIFYVYVNDPVSENIEVDYIVDEELRYETKTALKDIIRDLKEENRIDLTEINRKIEEIMECVVANKDKLIHIQSVRNMDEYVFDHSVSTTVFSIKTALKMNMNRSLIKEIALGTMLHDIGKINIRTDVLEKTDKLTENEYEEVKEHVKYGYKLIKNEFEISSLAKYVVRFHHEKNDGSGYPEGRTEDKLHQAVKIVSVCDVFDALTSDRPFRERWPNNKALDFIISKGGVTFDREVVKAFKDVVALYPIGTKVTLNDGTKALVSGHNEYFPERPVVKIIEDEQGNEIENPKVINLLEANDLVVVDSNF
ncbi:MAG: HD-GYP domain-containing protein [Bacillota bacterium]